MTVSFEHDGSVAVIGLDDGKANAITLDVLAAIDAGLAKARDGGAAAVLITGRPGRFSAGLRPLGHDRPARTRCASSSRAGAELLMRLFTCPMPVVCACTGHALAMGSLRVARGDVRIGAAGDFKIGLNEVAIGMGLPIFAIELARYRLTPAGFNAALLGEVFDPEDAVGGGLPRSGRRRPTTSSATRYGRLAGSPSCGPARSRTRSSTRGARSPRTILDTLQDDMASLSGPNPRT